MRKLPWQRTVVEANQADRVKTALRRYADTNCVVVAECGNASQGLVANHAYSVFSLQTVNIKEKQHDIVLMRNPWGTQVWQGDWGPSSARWTQASGDSLGSSCVVLLSQCCCDGDEGGRCRPSFTWVRHQAIRVALKRCPGHMCFDVAAVVRRTNNRRSKTDYGKNAMRRINMRIRPRHSHVHASGNVAVALLLLQWLTGLPFRQASRTGVRERELTAAVGAASASSTRVV